MTVARMTKKAITTIVGLLLAVSLTAQDSASALESVDCAPDGDLRGNAARGSDLHLENCASCHGYDGKAEVIVMHMDEPPKDQSDPDYMNTLSDAFLYLAVCRGGEAVGRSLVMQGWGDVLSDQDIRDLIAHIRTFSGT